MKSDNDTHVINDIKSSLKLEQMKETVKNDIVKITNSTGNLLCLGHFVLFEWDCSNDEGTETKKVFGIPVLTQGGSIPGFGGGDVHPAMLEPGEFIVNKYATAKHRSFLESINDGGKPSFKNGIPHFSKGGEYLSKHIQYGDVVHVGDMIKELGMTEKEQSMIYSSLRMIPPPYNVIFNAGANSEVDPVLFGRWAIDNIPRLFDDPTPIGEDSANEDTEVSPETESTPPPIPPDPATPPPPKSKPKTKKSESMDYTMFSNFPARLREIRKWLVELRESYDNKKAFDLSPLNGVADDMMNHFSDAKAFAKAGNEASYMQQMIAAKRRLEESISFAAVEDEKVNAFRDAFRKKENVLAYFKTFEKPQKEKKEQYGEGEFENEIRDELREEFEDEIRDELREEFEDEIRYELREELESKIRELEELEYDMLPNALSILNRARGR